MNGWPFMSSLEEGEGWEPGLFWIWLGKRWCQRGLIGKAGRIFSTHTDLRKGPLSIGDTGDNFCIGAKSCKLCLFCIARELRMVFIIFTGWGGK